MEAGIENADIMIAVTGSDKLNLLCCLIAQKTSRCLTIARDRVELLKFKVLPEFNLDGLSVSRITEKLQFDVLFCAVESDGRVAIPGGNHILHDGDFVSILASSQNAALFFKKSA